jgi:DNA-binding transcriptional LysR family regulator
VAGLRSGRVDVSALPTLAADPLAGIVGRFRRRYPGIVVGLAAPDDSAEVISAVRSGTVEIGLTERPARGAADDLTVSELARQELWLVLPPGSAVPESGVSMRRFATQPLVATPRGTSTRRLLDEACHQAGVEPTIAVETAQREAVLPLVLGGAGGSLLPRPLAETARQLGAVVSTLRPAVHRTVVLIHRHGTLAPAAAAFVETARADVAAAP